MTKRLFCLTLLLTVGILSYNFAQDNTKVGLPEGAIARLGKRWNRCNGGSHRMVLRLAVGTEIGAWVYDVNTGAGTVLFPTALRHANNRAFGTIQISRMAACPSCYH